MIEMKSLLIGLYTHDI